MGITHVIRGEEWISSAPKHLQLYEAFGEGLRASFHSMSMRFDSYLETGQSFGPMGDMDWWPVFYADKWNATLKNVRMPDWDFEDDRCVTVTQNGETQRFVLP